MTTFQPELQETLSAEDLLSVCTQLAADCVCPVCMNSLYAPVSVCRNGHGVCRECRPRLDKCPLCKLPFPSSMSTLLNSLLEHIPRKCRFDGCEVFLKLGDTHERWCGFQQVKCTNCEWTGPGKDLLNHFLAQHITNFGPIWDFYVILLTYEDYYLAFETRDHLVLLKIEKDFQDNCIRATFSHVPNGLKITCVTQLTLVIGDEFFYSSSSICVTPANWLNGQENIMTFAFASLANAIHSDKLGLKCRVTIKYWSYK